MIRKTLAFPYSLSVKTFSFTNISNAASAYFFLMVDWYELRMSWIEYGLLCRSMYSSTIFFVSGISIIIHFSLIFPAPTYPFAFSFSLSNASSFFVSFFSFFSLGSFASFGGFPSLSRFLVAALAGDLDFLSVLGSALNSSSLEEAAS